MGGGAPPPPALLGQCALRTPHTLDKGQLTPTEKRRHHHQQTTSLCFASTRKRERVAFPLIPSSPPSPERERYCVALTPCLWVFFFLFPPLGGGDDGDSVFLEGDSVMVLSETILPPFFSFLFFFFLFLGGVAIGLGCVALCSRCLVGL